jgi:hypothetical protein
MVVANNIDPNVLERFVWGIRGSETRMPFDILFGKHENPKETFRKTTILNDILRENLDKYETLVQTDIDMLIPPNLIAMTHIRAKDIKTCFHCEFRYVGTEEVKKWMLTGYPTIPWTSFGNRKRFCASGSWNGMSSATWRVSGGFNESIFNLGGPDTEFYLRCLKLKINWVRELNCFLSHINHRRRAVPKQGKQNLSTARKYPLNYQWLSNRFEGVSPTIITKIGVNYK